MNLSRVTIGLATLIFVTVPLLGLAQLSYDIRYVDFIGTYAKADQDFPFLASQLWIFGPLDWWSFLTPLSLAVAVAAIIRTPLRPSSLALILGSSALQAIILIATAKPYFLLTKIMGYPEHVPYPRVPLVANLSLVGIALGLAVFSVSRSRAHARANIQKAEHVVGGNGG